MRTLLLIGPSLLGLLAVAGHRLSNDDTLTPTHVHSEAVVGALPCLDCSGCEASTITVPTSLPGLTVNLVPSVESAADGVCDTQSVCVGTTKCVFSDNFQINDQTGLSLVYIADGTEVDIRPGVSYIAVKHKKVTCDVGSSGPFENVHTVCIHALINGNWVQVWARHYICSWCEDV